MPERIFEPPLAQSVGLIGDRGNLDRAACDRLGGDAVGVGDEQVDPHGRALKAPWTEIRRCRCLVSHSEPGVSYRQLRDYRAVRRGNAMHLFGAESPLVEGDRFRRPADRQHGRNTGAKRHRRHSRAGKQPATTVGRPEGVAFGALAKFHSGSLWVGALTVPKPKPTAIASMTSVELSVMRPQDQPFRWRGGLTRGDGEIVVLAHMGFRTGSWWM